MSEDVPANELQTETVDQPRRRFFGAAAMTIAAAQLGVIASAAQTDKAASKVSAIRPDTNSSFKALKQIDAGLPEYRLPPKTGLPMAQRSSCCTVGRTTYTAMSTSVAAVGVCKGYHVIVPYLRGYGSDALPVGHDTFRNAQPRSP